MWDFIIPMPAVCESNARAQECGWALYGFYSIDQDNGLVWNYVTDTWSTIEADFDGAILD